MTPTNPAPPKKRHRWIRRVILGTGLVILLPILLLAFCVGPPPYYHEKYAPVGPAILRSRPLTPVAEHQTEPHTCGLHAMSSLYAAYGLDTTSRRLRFRLGTDKPFTNFIPDSLGTIHPDMLRVLHQDGFDTDLVSPSASSAAADLSAHLDSGQLAIALIKVTGYHWVLLAGRHDDNVIICDSLRDTLYEEPLTPYVRDRLYTLILVKPHEPHR